MQEGGLMGAAFNGAKEEALDAFLARRIRFTDMARVVEKSLDALSGERRLPCLGPDPATPAVEDILEADRLGRRGAAEAVEQMRVES
jgi:1-deoxy-D-xylulose-5-phosphate reductoisomerase